jgi:hypothetical protein
MIQARVSVLVTAEVRQGYRNRRSNFISALQKAPVSDFNQHKSKPLVTVMNNALHINF